MTTATAAHVAGEELMALVDGELTGTEQRTVEEHLASCELCAGEVTRLQEEASALKGWSVPELPAKVETKVLARLNSWSTQSQAPRGWAGVPPRRRLWYGAAALTAGAVTLALFIFSGIAFPPTPQFGAQQPSASTAPADAALASAAVPPPPAMAAPAYSRNFTQARMAALSEDKEKLAAVQDYSKMMRAPAPSDSRVDALRQSAAATSPLLTGPMIARTVALTLIVKDVERSHQSLEELLRTYNGYAAQMEISTPEAGRRSLHASLRVPSGQLRGMLAELKGYGKVANETQSGEEVGQQHADLVARLNTARESEERLRGILKNRTGDVSDVLQVEREIARVREQIESMEAEQQALEHRVTYATVDLQMNQEGQGPVSPGVISRLAAGARQGWENATETALGLSLFILQYSLATFLILAPIAIVLWFVWRRRRTPHSNP